MVRARKTFFKEKGEAEAPVVLSHLKIYPGESLLSNTGCSGEGALSKLLLVFVVYVSMVIVFKFLI